MAYRSARDLGVDAVVLQRHGNRADGLYAPLRRCGVGDLGEVCYRFLLSVVKIAAQFAAHGGRAALDAVGLGMDAGSDSHSFKLITSFHSHC